MTRYQQFNRIMRIQILKRDGYRCVYCGEPASEIDHVILPRDGGVTGMSNGVACCKSCNRYKKNHPSDIRFVTRGLFWIATHEG